MSWVAALSELERAAEAGVLVTILSARGSAPREAGCKMVVSAGRVFGTIGGGRLEHAAIGIAREILDGTLGGVGGSVTRDFPLGPALGQCCGGHVSLLFEPVRPPSWEVALFGAGHVGRAVASLLATLPCRLTWIDARAEEFPAGAEGRVCPDPVGEVAGLPAGGFMLVMTHDHGLDYDLIAAALRRGDLGFVGLIGSETKRARFSGRLVRAGIDDAALVCPIGLPGIVGKHPAEIAVSVVAQMMQARQGAAYRVQTQAIAGIAAMGNGTAGCGVKGCACP